MDKGNNMEQRRSPLSSAIRESLPLLCGEVLVSLLVVAVYIVIGSFDYKVVTGAVLGTLVVVLNYLFLSLSVNRAVKSFLDERGSRDMSEEEIEAFSREHTVKIQNTVKVSYLIRTVSMLIALVGAFLLEWFLVIPTLIPLVMLRPIIYLEELILNKKGK